MLRYTSRVFVCVCVCERTCACVYWGRGGGGVLVGLMRKITFTGNSAEKGSCQGASTARFCLKLRFNHA